MIDAGDPCRRSISLERNAGEPNRLSNKLACVATDVRSPFRTKKAGERRLRSPA
jgi:hypothetical protein